MLELIPLPYRILIAAAFAGAVLFGAFMVGSNYQKAKTDLVQAEYDGFVAQVKTEGAAAIKAAKLKEDADIRLKETSDATYTARLAALNADIDRMRHNRSGGSYLPTPRAAASSPNRICFDRTKLELALQQLDGDVSGIVGEGDAARLRLSVAHDWGQAGR